MNHKSILGVVAFLSAAGLAGCAGDSGAAADVTEIDTAGEEITMTGRIPIRLFYWIQCCGAEEVERVADRFNDSQDDIQLILEFPPGDIHDLADAYESGDGPDIVGPLEGSAWEEIPVAWLDLAPWIRSESYDLTQFHPGLADMYKTAEGRLSLPFTVYPSIVFYNSRLFDEANLAYPPAAYGETYRMPDGSEVEWNWDAVRDVARLLTLDDAGKNAVDPGFDESDIRQYGFTWQYLNRPDYWGSYWARGSMLAPGGSPGKYAAQVPDAWRAAWRWTYDAIWSDRPFMGTDGVEGNPDFGDGNPFDSGKFAMTIEPSWYLCCVENSFSWDVAALPAWNGKVGGRVEESTFRIWKETKRPREALAVLAYLLGEGARALILGGEDTPALYTNVVPARTADQKDWMDARKQEFPWVRNWEVVLEGLNYTYPVGADTGAPNSSQAWLRGLKFADLLRSTGGLDLDKEIDSYLRDLTEIYNQ